MTTTVGRVRIEQGQRQVRVMFAGEVVATTAAPLLVWERPHYPTYYFREEDVRTDRMSATGQTRRSPSRGEYSILDLTVGDRVAREAVSFLGESPIDELAGTYRFDWAAMDHWFEEDEEVFVHARDPYTRVDALRSSRHVEVVVDGMTVADSHHAVVLYETGLPPRWYVPKVDVRMDLLTPTATVSACPYKGTARYWTLTTPTAVHEDLVWGYDAPLAESAPIAGLVCFYNERVDLVIDGEPIDRPRTHHA